MNKVDFIFDWVLINKLAIGNSPKENSDIKFLKMKGIKSILNLCYEDEAPHIKDESKIPLRFFRFPLPDHKHKNLLTTNQILQSLNVIDDLIKSGPVFIHCFASVERSPLICMAWLIKYSNLSLRSSLDYMKQVHPQTNPLVDNLKKLENL